MKYFPWLFMILLFSSCSNIQQKKDTHNTLEKQVLKAFNGMYDSYSEGTVDFFSFYENDFVRVDGKGNINTGVDKPIEEWKEFMEKYTLKLMSIDSPKMVLASDQVITINDYYELFINKNTSDTIFNKGVYIAAWRKQSDSNWKISMDTWHAGLE